MAMDMNRMMKEARKMQAEMERTQAELEEREFSATAGGGGAPIDSSRFAPNPSQFKILSDGDGGGTCATAPAPYVPRIVSTLP